MRWTTRHEDAARLVADDRLSNEQIARRVGLSRRGLDEWKLDAEFAARVASLVTAAREAALAEAIAVKAERLRDYQELRRRLWATIAARAEEGEKARDGGDSYGRLPAPGAEYGLMVKKLSPLGKGPVEEWAVDTAVIAELRNLDKQAAQEMGDWTEKSETKHDGSSTFLDALRSFGSGQQGGGGA